MLCDVAYCIYIKHFLGTKCCVPAEGISPTSITKMQCVASTFDHFQVIGDLLQDGEAGQNQAEGATQVWPWAALWLVPLAALQQHSHSDNKMVTVMVMVVVVQW